MRDHAFINKQIKELKESLKTTSEAYKPAVEMFIKNLESLLEPSNNETK